MEYNKMNIVEDGSNEPSVCNYMDAVNIRGTIRASNPKSKNSIPYTKNFGILPVRCRGRP